MKCRVLEPVAFTSDGKGHTCWRVGAVVDVDDEQAKELVAEGKLVSVEPKAVKTVQSKSEK